MLLSDTREIKADPKVVWDAILNPDVLKECIPGCESLKGSVAEGYEAVVKQKVGPVSATFTGLVQLSDIVEGKSLKISGEGKGGDHRRKHSHQGLLWWFTTNIIALCQTAASPTCCRGRSNFVSPARRHLFATLRRPARNELETGRSMPRMPVTPHPEP